MAVRTAITKARTSGTRRWFVPEHPQGPGWPVNPVEPEVSWPMYQTLTPGHFVQRWNQAAFVIDPQFLRDVFDYLSDEDLGALRWYEEPFYAVHYWREASQWPEPPPGLLSQLVELLRRAFVAVDRTGNIHNFYNLAGQKVDDVDLVAGPPGRRGSLWFVGHGPPTLPAPPNVLEQDIYLNLDNGDVYQFSGGAFRLVT